MVRDRAKGLLCMHNDLPLAKDKYPLVWAIISGKTPPKTRVLPAWGGVGQVIDGCIKSTDSMIVLNTHNCCIYSLYLDSIL